MKIDAAFPEKLQFLFKPSRYKVAYGGRGSAKSWSFARALLIKAVNQPIRILCAREVQKSIKQSVHTLLVDQIQALGLGPYFQPFENEIKGKSGSSFVFAGLAQHTVESIKSFEGVDIVWVEEAQTVSKRSWDILIPTIRKEESEIWVSFNPDLDTDDTYTRFVTGTRADAIVAKVNYSDNPWFPLVLEKERLECKRNRPEDYDNIWEGHCKSAVDGAIYANEIRDAQESGRIANVSYDPLLKVQVVFDLGWNDSMAISLIQRSSSEIRIIEYIEDDHKTLDYYSSLLKEKKLNWGSVYLPHDGKAKDFKSGKSAEDIMKALGWQVEIVPKIDVEGGLKLARMTFPRCYFNKDKTSRLIECLKHYRRSINSSTNEPGSPLHDEYSHGADNFRYICVAADQMSNDDYEFNKVIEYNTKWVV